MKRKNSLTSAINNTAKLVIRLVSEHLLTVKRWSTKSMQWTYALFSTGFCDGRIATQKDVGDVRTYLPFCAVKKEMMGVKIYSRDERISSGYGRHVRPHQYLLWLRNQSSIFLVFDFCIFVNFLLWYSIFPASPVWTLHLSRKFAFDFSNHVFFEVNQLCHALVLRSSSATWYTTELF